MAELDKISPALIHRRASRTRAWIRKVLDWAADLRRPLLVGNEHELYDRCIVIVYVGYACSG